MLPAPPETRGARFLKAVQAMRPSNTFTGPLPTRPRGKRAGDGRTFVAPYPYLKRYLPSHVHGSVRVYLVVSRLAHMI
jgi:hypothetical protein